MWERLTHLFLPHHTNNHRARALHYDAMLLYVLAFFAFQVVVRFVAVRAPDILGYATDIYVEQLLVLTNAKRAEAGLEPLTLNSQLSQAAALKAQDMFANGYWAHTSPQGKTPWEFIRTAGYGYTVAGENLAKNFGNSQGVVDAWMASPSHKDNLLKANYRDIGFAVVNGVLNGEETTLVVQMFGTTAAPVVRQVAAASPPRPTVIPTARPTLIPVTPTPFPETEPTAVPARPVVENETYPVAAAVAAPGQPPAGWQGLFLGVTSRPVFNLETINKAVSFGFAGFLIALFIADTFIVTRKRIVRATGNTVAHILFLSSLAVSFALVSRGVVL